MKRTSPKPKTIPPVRPNAGIEAAYRKRLIALVEAMNVSVRHWLEAAYKANQPVILAQDELPAEALRAALAKMGKRWQKNFDAAAPKLARYFARSAGRRSDKVLENILRDAGFSVAFKMTKAQKDILRATVNQNVSLIRSIPQRYFTEVEGMVMRSVQTGRDLHTLSEGLQHQYGVTKRRAALISRDQNNKATSALVRARQVELGITEAIWVHSSAGKEPRPTHVANDGKRYNTETGWFDPHEQEYIFPGQLINCRCTSRSILPGLS